MADASQPRIDPALLEGGIARAPQAPGQPTPGPSPSPSWYQSLKRWWRGDRSDEPAAGPLARTESVPSGDTSAESADWAPLPYPQYADDEPAAMAEESIPRAGAMVEQRVEVAQNRLDHAPWAAICLLRIRHVNGCRTHATGFLTRSGLVATAAHVVLHPSPEFGAAEEIVVIPALLQASGGNLARAQTAVRWFRNANWGVSGQGFLAANDYAALELPNPTAFATCGAFAWGEPDDFDASRRFIISGYPGEKVGQWRDIGNADSPPGPNTLRHTIMTTPGQSGSPMFWMRPDQSFAVAGIHSKEASDIPGTNVACRVTQRMLADFASWAQGNGPAIS